MMLIALAAAALTVAQPTGPVSQIGATSDPSEATNGSFGAKMFITGDVDGFWKAWEGPTPPNISTTSTITQAKPVTAMIVFAGCQAAADGNCNVSVSFSMTGPDGSPYDKPQGAKAWTRAPAPGRNLLASLASLGFRLEPQDKLGSYRMIARITDEVAGESLTISETVVAEAH